MNNAVGDLERVEPGSERQWEFQGRRLLAVARLLALGVLCTLILRVAWIGDDSLITLRTALNLWHGWGAGFNATESVQAYTHPLWFLLWLISGAVSGEWILTVVALGVICSLGSVVIALWSARSVAVVILATGALGLSNAFMEYTTSGLENPLAYLLVGVLFVFSLRSDDQASRLETSSCLLLGLTMAGVALTRLDLPLIALPAALVFAWRTHSNARALLAATLAFVLPLSAWFAWSYLTYGTLLPNTFAAKRNLVIPIAEFLFQGFRYLWVSIDHDPVTGLVLAVGLFVGVAWGPILQRAWAAGVVLYLAYVVYIGGDFMAGRFLAVPAYVAVLLIVTSPIWDVFDPSAQRSSVGEARSFRAADAWIVVTSAVVLLIAAGREPVALLNPETERWEYERAAGVADERGFYLTHSRGIGQWLMNPNAPRSVPRVQRAADVNAYASLSDVRAAANNWPKKSESVVSLPVDVGVRCGVLGSLGILSGPGIHWIDRCALTDRFLAETPYTARGLRWRAGHYLRSVPEGYVNAVANNDSSLVTDRAEAQRLSDLWSSIRD